MRPLIMVGRIQLKGSSLKPPNNWYSSRFPINSRMVDWKIYVRCSAKFLNFTVHQENRSRLWHLKLKRKLNYMPIIRDMLLITLTIWLENFSFSDAQNSLRKLKEQNKLQFIAEFSRGKEWTDVTPVYEEDGVLFSKRERSLDNTLHEPQLEKKTRYLIVDRNVIRSKEKINSIFL